MRITKEPEERKTEIIDAAEELFLTKGYYKTTIIDILQKVGIAKGTFYYHFQSKEEVMDAIVMRFINKGVENAKVIASNPDLTAPEKLFQILMSPQPGTENKQQMVDQFHQVNNAEMHQKSLVETILKLTPILTAVIEQGIEEGVFKTPYPRETVEFLLVSSQFLFDEGIFQWQPAELMKKAAAFSSIMENVLEAEKGTFSYISELFGKMPKKEKEEEGD
ncbi:TetR/AcrR family transcriptional regulator [Metabacillus fastidiosus]|uniref:TetR/AcrR family transcriptional regulator n=1 Tax=Metabacillus fastidiosus TaxID=1458 RepID=UPI003D27EF8A